MKDFLIEKLPQGFRRNESKESLIADPNCPSELIKNKKWNEIARQAIHGDLKLADIGKKCTLIPPATHLEILDAMMRPKAGIKENEDFSIEFNFKYFGQSENEGKVLAHPLIAHFYD